MVNDAEKGNHRSHYKEENNKGVSAKIRTLTDAMNAKVPMNLNTCDCVSKTVSLIPL